MKIAACLGVKDEIDLIELCVEHLHRIGVDHIIACDFGSTDGAKAVLEAQARRRDDFTLIELDDSASDARFWFEAMADVVHRGRALDADWMIFLDADEFWLPATGDLKTCASMASEADLLKVARFNVPVSTDGPLAVFPLTPDAYVDTWLFVQRIPEWRKFLGDNPHAAWITGVPDVKIAARPCRISGLHMGHHDADPEGPTPLAVATPVDLVIAHLPFTTQTRFARKVANMRAVIERHDTFFGVHLAWHWRRWLEIADRDGVAAEFARNCVDRQEFQEFHGKGRIRSAAEWLAEWGSRRSREDLPFGY